MVDTFIRRPILASVCSLVIILAGAIAIPTMPVAQYPELAPPQVSVMAFYTGANAQAVETAVTTPLEQAINGVEGMLYMSSSSTNAGVCQINVTFDVTRDIDLAAVDVQNRVNQAIGRMPAEVRTTGITVQKQSTNFVLGAGVYSETGTYDSLFMSNYIDVYVKDALKRLPGVGDVMIFGERKYSMRLWLDPTKLAARELTAGDVVNALREQNVQVAAGSIGDAPAREGPDLPDQRPRRGPAARGQRVPEHHRQVGRARQAWSGSATSAPPSSGRRPTPHSCGSRASTPSASASSSCQPPTRSTSSGWFRPSCCGCRNRSHRG